MKLRTRTLLLASILFVAACSASDEVSDPEGITADELRAGASSDGVDAESDEELDFADDAPVDPDADLDDADASDDSSTQSLRVQSATSGCSAAAGFVRGIRTSICVVRIDGKPVERATAAAFVKMRSAAARAGVNIHVVSGFRTMEEQRRLYRLYKEGRGNKAAAPGFSNHQSGHALDLNTRAPGVYAWLTRHGAQYGFRRTVPSEKWHWEH